MLSKVISLWKKIAQKVANIQAKIILTFIYVLILPLAAIFVHIFKTKFDWGKNDKKSNWQRWEENKNYKL